MKVIITSAARAALTAIGEFIERENPARAATFLEELVGRCEDLAHSPLRFPLLSGHEAEASVGEYIATTSSSIASTRTGLRCCT